MVFDHSATINILITSCMSFVADLRDDIHGFHFADRRLSQLPTPQAANSSSHNYRAGHTFRRVANEDSKAETALFGSVNILITKV